jgi:hypothetical protein
MSVYDAADAIQALVIGAIKTTAVTTVFGSILCGFAPRFTLRWLLRVFPPGYEDYREAVFNDLCALPYRKQWTFVGGQLEAAVNVAIPARLRYQRGQRASRRAAELRVAVPLEIVINLSTYRDKSVSLRRYIWTRQQLDQVTEGIEEGRYRITANSRHTAEDLVKLGLIRELSAAEQLIKRWKRHVCDSGGVGSHGVTGESPVTPLDSYIERFDKPPRPPRCLR